MFAHGKTSLQLFPVMWTFLRSLDVICYNWWVLSQGHKKLLWGLMSHKLAAYLSVFNLFKLIKTMLSKAWKPDNFELRNSLKLSFTNIWGFRSNFVDCETFLESNSPEILALCERNLDDSIDSSSFFVRGYLLLIRKDSSTHIYDLAVYVKEGLPFERDLSLQNSEIHTYVFDWLYFTQCLTSISSNIDEVLSINPSANVLVFEDFNVHHNLF